jgi:hypothetical protein
MKKLFAFFLVASVLCSCKNDLDITGDYKETPIVYGLLNIDSTNHYIKIYRAFLDASTSSLEIAQNPDSIYYADSIIVSIEKKSGGAKKFLQKVTLNGLDEGVFAQSPNIAYKFTETLNPNETYVLRFENPKTGKVAIAETPIVNDFQVNSPIPTFKYNFNSQNSLSVEWKAAINSRTSDVFMRVFYNEWNVNTPGNKERKFIDISLAKNVASKSGVGGEQLSADFSGSIFYTSLAAKLSNNADLRRDIDEFPIQVFFNVGGESLYDYIRVNQAQSGITSLQTLPEFTNVDGGLGIFSSRKSKIIASVGLTSLSIDSLSCGSITRGLNFVNVNCD